MTDKIVPMPGQVLMISQRGHQPNPKTIEALEALLEQAQTGEVQAIACVSLDAAGSFKTGWTTQSNGDALFAIGALQVLSQEMAHNFYVRRAQ